MIVNLWTIPKKMNVDVNRHHIARNIYAQFRHHQNAINVNLLKQPMIHAIANLYFVRKTHVKLMSIPHVMTVNI